MHVQVLTRPMPDAVARRYARREISPAKVRPDDPVAIRPAQRCFTIRLKLPRAIVEAAVSAADSLTRRLRFHGKTLHS